MSLLRHVNPLQGADSHHGFSTGNTLPLIAMPFGMNHWSPQTAEGGWFFSPRQFKLQGIRCTHQPSPWMGDYGAFTIMPQVGRRLLPAGRRASSYRLDRSVIAPNHFRAELIQSGTTLEMTPTERGAIFRFDFPKDGRVIFDPAGGESFVSVREDRRTVVGFTRHNTGGAPAGFAHWFIARFDCDISGWCSFSGEEVWEEEAPRTGNRVGIAVEVGGGQVTMRLATSFISEEQAELNLRNEIGDAGFEEILAQGAKVWEENLGRIIIEDEDDRRLRTFYSCLYRTQLFPRIWHEPDAVGQLHHFSPYDGQVHPGVLYTDNGFWDTYRTEYPLLALLSPGRLNQILQGWVNAYKEGGWFPQWATPGYRACMVGTHIDAVMADAVVRGVVGFDVETALDGLLKHAYEVGDPAGAFGRIGIEDYLRLGYVTNAHHESVARSLDYAYDDFCIAQVADFVGRKDEAEKLRARSQNYRHLYDPAVGFMRAKTPDGAWQQPWSEFLWGNPYVEGGPWQSSWAVQHDPTGLIELMGGEEAFVAKLDRMLATPPRFEIGAYGIEIHEMTEMACANFGQYAHSNQPVHHVLYLYAAAGHPWRTQSEVRRVMDELYTPDRFAGDEDNGEMAAWYVLSSLGLFPLCPGRPEWVLGSPLFRRATIRLENGKEFVVEAPENSADNVYVQAVSLDGTPVYQTAVTHEMLSNGGTLRFEMGPEPKKEVVSVDNRPTSLST
ncbi:GH92 family glycosyl hydrolase [Fimbriimonas ginsengisoli]|uniref:Alpha-1,2-mannosidase n=1 Tax=Fimbriimonas ginsengisoli Gsoil 348 TaxID=661478 RepID=A0A068NRD6_FIMGI|nr:GH92 family glycosyl hydrolase [Fimbriimonas ginsengisoli]AIE86073.1 Alpha-1,2-mannosidase [Fimbriimonas ginsengisoli Gsoil 348]